MYIATVIDFFTREIVWIDISLRKGAPLTIKALSNALMYHPKPEIFHSDNGKEYDAKSFIGILEKFGIAISRSHPGCPWENGYQESFTVREMGSATITYAQRARFCCFVYKPGALGQHTNIFQRKS